MEYIGRTFGTKSSGLSKEVAAECKRPLRQVTLYTDVCECVNMLHPS